MDDGSHVVIPHADAALASTGMAPSIRSPGPWEQCRHLQDPNPYTVALASVILVGILVSYLPQHIKIIQRRSSDGLSPWWVLLGGLSSIAAIGNILVLPGSRADVKCCKEVTGGECAAALLGIAQIGLQWGCFMFIVMLFLTFFPPQTPPPDLAASLASLTSVSTPAPPRRRDAVLVGTLILLALFVTGLTSLATVAAFPHHTQTWANTLGIIAGTLSAIQYIPQIYFTWRLKDVKSLSIITMIIQVPGAFLFAFSLWLRVGWAGWSTWLVYLITGVLQAVLLSLAITYYMNARNVAAEDSSMAEEEDGDENGQVDERTALLSNGSGQRRGKTRPIEGTQRSQGSGRGLAMLYAATPPEHDSDRS